MKKTTLKESFAKELIVIDKSDINKMIGARMIVLESGIKKGLSPEAIRTHEAGIAALEWVLSHSKPSMPEQEWVSDKEIEKEFPIEKNNETIVNHYNLHSQIGAKWMRDKLLNKSNQ